VQKDGSVGTESNLVGQRWAGKADSHPSMVTCVDEGDFVRRRSETGQGKVLGTGGYIVRQDTQHVGVYTLGLGSTRDLWKEETSACCL
jgi:hypothetical protein